MIEALLGGVVTPYGVLVNTLREMFNLFVYFVLSPYKDLLEDRAHKISPLNHSFQVKNHMRKKIGVRFIFKR